MSSGFGYIISITELYSQAVIYLKIRKQAYGTANIIGKTVERLRKERGISQKDFISKMQIALKECYESEYWLELLNRTGYIPDEQYKSLQNTCGKIRRMLISSINTVKDNNGL